MFITSTGIAATSSDISTYNTHVQNAANNNAALRPYKSKFRALISTPTVHARDNTATTGTGVPIYWLGGEKVADDYADFYTGTWDSTAGKTEAGGNTPGWEVWTGSNTSGTGRAQDSAGGSGSTVVSATVGIISGNPKAKSSSLSLYAMSPVFTVGTVTVHGVTVSRFRTTPGDDRIALSWFVDPPRECGFVVEWREGSSGAWKRHEFDSWTYHVRHTITGLKSGTNRPGRRGRAR